MKKEKNEAQEKLVKMTNYKFSGITTMEYIIVNIVIFIVATALMFIFYKKVYFILAVIAGAVVTPMFYNEYRRSKIAKRKKKLRIQFCDMLESMSVSARAGNNELKSLEAALHDLKMSYNETSDIVIEVTNIIEKNKNGIPLRNLFKDFGERSGIEDIKSFGEIYEIIEGKSDKFADIIKQTQQIISDKMAIEEEIETVLTAPKNENKIMLFMPFLLVLIMGSGDGGFLARLYTEFWGSIVITICVAVFVAAYLLGQKMTDIDV